MNRKKIYNPESKEDVNGRKIFGGNPTGIFELNNIKYQWAYNLWEVMLNNTWFPKEVDMTKDVSDYKNLTDAEKVAYDKTLSQLIFMDSLQTNNLIDNVNPYVTAPEINLILVRQSFEEALHSQSYAVMVDSISTNSEEIYELWRQDMMLKGKNDAIAAVYDELAENPTDRNFCLPSRPSCHRCVRRRCDTRLRRAGGRCRVVHPTDRIRSIPNRPLFYHSARRRRAHRLR